MARLECDHERTDGVTLVTCRLESYAARRVTVEPTHDGPIWPPRRQGVPAAGWEGDTWTGVVGADETRGLGYATPAEPADDPVRIVDVGAADGEDGDVSARDVIRSLGDPSPPRDAVPTEDGATRGAAPTVAGSGRESDPSDPDGRAVRTPSDADGQVPRTPSDADVDGRAAGTDPRPERETRDAPLANSAEPTPVAGAARLDAIEQRLATAADLAAVSAPAEARSAVADAGGLVAVRSLVEQLDADRAYLRRVRERTDSLAERAEGTTVPLAALERLA